MKFIVFYSFFLTSVLSINVDPIHFINDFKLAIPTCNEAARKWIRAAFHDAGTYDMLLNTGGSDGSLQFEFDLHENLGLEPVIHFYKNIVIQRGISFADAIMFGGKLAVEVCNGPVINWKSGRIDAFSPNERNKLPNPHISADDTIHIFVNRLGFSNYETIALILGAHSVAKVNIPIDENKIGFTDSTPSILDNLIFKEILGLPPTMHNIITIPSDKNLLQNLVTKNIMIEFSYNETLFKFHFKTGFEKLINLGANFGTNNSHVDEIHNNITSPLTPPPIPRSQNSNNKAINILLNVYTIFFTIFSIIVIEFN